MDWKISLKLFHGYLNKALTGFLQKDFIQLIFLKLSPLLTVITLQF